jgi:Cu-processing system permease protein
VGIISSLIMPSESVWRRASFEMQSALVRSFGGLSPFSSQSAPSAIMVVYAAAYAAIMLFFAMRRFSKKDL